MVPAVASGHGAGHQAHENALAQLPDPRDVRDPLAVLLGTRLVALAGGTDTMAAIAESTVAHQAWFRLWLPLGWTVPTDDTYRLLVRRLEPETAMQAALLLLDGTCPPGLQELILALAGKCARRSGDPAAGTRPLPITHKSGDGQQREVPERFVGGRPLAQPQAAFPDGRRPRRGIVMARGSPPAGP